MSLASAMASSSVLKRNSGATGPNVSSRATFISGVTSVITVGSKNLPPSACRLPPSDHLGALGDASATCSSTFSTAACRSADPGDARLECRCRPSASPPRRRASRRKRRRRRPAREMRLAQTQVWPVLRYLEAIAPSTAASRSASSKTMNGALPPSSMRDLLHRRRRTARMSILPISVEPVKVSLRTFGFEVSSPPISLAVPVTTLKTPFGHAGALGELGQRQRRQRRLRRRLADHRAAGSQRRSRPCG